MPAPDSITDVGDLFADEARPVEGDWGLHPDNGRLGSRVFWEEREYCLWYSLRLASALLTLAISSIMSIIGMTPIQAGASSCRTIMTFGAGAAKDGDLGGCLASMKHRSECAAWAMRLATSAR